jgi:hypothetical protein
MFRQGNKHYVIPVLLSSNKDRQKARYSVVTILHVKATGTRNGYIQLDLVGNAMLPMLLGILGMGGDRAHHSRAHHARGIGGTRGRVGCEVGCAKDGFFEVCRTIYPTNLLHVGYPDVLSSRCGLDGEREESDGVSENCKNSGEWDRRNRINCETYASPR